MKASCKYFVQIITDAAQLTEAFSMRCRVYRKTYPLAIGENQVYESDAFDARSVHLGLYCEDGCEKTLAGYSRLILPAFFSGSFSDVLLTKHPLYTYHATTKAMEKMSFIERMPEQYKLLINHFCDSQEAQHIVYAETSRFIIDEKHRSLALSSFFVSGMFAVCEALNIKYSFFTCTHHHVPFYSRFGLTLFPGMEPYDNEVFGSQYVIFGTDLKLASKVTCEIKDLKTELETEKQITFKRAA